MAELLSEHAWRLGAMAVLLALSAFFSGSETALFSLSRDRLRRFRTGPNRLEHVAARLVARPRILLVTILFGNMLVNVMFFALSSALVWDIGERSHAAWAGGVAGALVLVAVVVFGEVAPKTIAATSPVRTARWAALPLYLLSRALRPLGWLMDHAIIEPATRLITGQVRGRRADLFLTAGELQAIVDLAADEGVVGRDEGEMIGEVLRIHETKVREVMVPRVDMVACDVDRPTAEAVKLFRRTKHKRLVAYRGTIDEVVGLVSARRVFLDPDRPLAELAEPVEFVPEQQTVERLLKVFREKKIPVAVVVDEYGGTAGLATLEDCLEEIVGEIRDEYEEPPPQPVERLSGREFLLSGDLSMRAWSDYLRTELDTEARADTVGGFVTGLLGRIPQAGDSCRWGNLRFTVRQVRPRSVNDPHGRPLKVLVEVVEGEGPGGEDSGGGAAAGGEA